MLAAEKHMSNISKWGEIWLFVVLMFATIYWLFWMKSPDSFIIHQELNVEPFPSQYWFPYEDVKIANIATKPSLYTLMESINRKKEQIVMEESLGPTYDQKIREFQEKLNQASDENERLRMENFNKYLQIKINGAPTEKQSIRAEIEARELFLENLQKFADPDIDRSVGKFNNDLLAAYKAQEEHEDIIAQLRSELMKLYESSKASRLDHLNWIDFFYYSVGISTTTTYGEVIANTKFTRMLVTVQLLLSVLVVGLFVNSAVELAANE